MNGEYIKKLSLDEFHKYALPYYEEIFTKEEMETYNLLKLSEQVQTRIEVFTEIPELVAFVKELPNYDISIYSHKKMKTNPENSLVTLEKALPALEALEDWTFDALNDVIYSLVKELEVKNGVVFWPVRTALSGEASSPGGAFELAEILGKKRIFKKS